MSREEIQRIAVEKKIPFLVHFTRFENVSSIMNNGLLPVSYAHGKGISPVVNDEIRLDGRLNGTSLSVSFPNGSLFYRFRNDKPDVSWVILAISTSVFGPKRHYSASITLLTLELVTSMLSIYRHQMHCWPCLMKLKDMSLGWRRV